MAVIEKMLAQLLLAVYCHQSEQKIDKIVINIYSLKDANLNKQLIMDFLTNALHFAVRSSQLPTVKLLVEEYGVSIFSVPRELFLKDITYLSGFNIVHQQIKMQW